MEIDRRRVLTLSVLQNLRTRLWHKQSYFLHHSVAHIQCSGLCCCMALVSIGDQVSHQESVLAAKWIRQQNSPTTAQYLLVGAYP